MVFYTLETQKRIGIWLIGLLFLFEGLLAFYFEEKVVLSFPFLIGGVSLVGAALFTELEWEYILLLGGVCFVGLFLTAGLIRRTKKRREQILNQKKDWEEIDPRTGRKRTPPV